MIKTASIGAVVVVVALGAFAFYLYQSRTILPPIEGPAMPAEEDAGLLIDDIVVGQGPVVDPDYPVVLSLSYTGSYDDGEVFQDEKSIDYLMSVDEAPLGWSKGLTGMKIGGTRVITILPTYSERAKFADQFPSEKAVIYKITLYNMLDTHLNDPLVPPEGTPQVQPGFESL